MPRRAQYTIKWLAKPNTYAFTGPTGKLSSFLQGEEWLQWLGEHTAFAFHGRNGQLNLLKERRRASEGYWYAYQRQETGMVKRYLGRSEQVTLERLEEVATLLKYASTYHDASNIEPSVVLPRAPMLPNASTSQPPQFEPLLMPKLQIPRLQSTLLPREHLWSLLNKGLEHKLTIVAGPAGYGKTTAVYQWLAERNPQEGFPRIASLTLDEGDNDVIRFWRYIIAACQAFLPGCGKEALDLLRAHRLPPFKPLQMMLTALLNELSQLEHPAVLVLDDCHVLHTPQVIETLSFFLDHLPNALHLYMLLRGDPPFSVMRLRARNELLDIYPPYLAFSLEETRAFFARELAFPLTPKELRLIHEQLEGWGTGLRLLAHFIAAAADRRAVEQMLQNFTHGHWSVRAYLFEEVLHSLTPEQQEFLLESCILPLITAELCDAICKREDSASMLQILRTGDLFLIPLDTSAIWTRYHSLFADTMRQEAYKRLGKPRLQQLLNRASTWYEAHNLYAEAIETALDASDIARALDLLEHFLKEKLPLAAQELYTLHRWFVRLPEKELAHHPDLCVQYAMTLLFLLMEEPQHHPGREQIDLLLRLAEERWRDVNNIEKLAEIFAFRALLTRQEGNILQAVTWARQALAWLPQQDRTWRNLALTVVGTGEILAGDLREARKVLLEALAFNEQQGNFLYARATRGMLAWGSCEQGALRHTAEQFRQMLGEAQAQEDCDDIARSLYGLAQIYYQWNNLAPAQEMAREALEVSEQSHIEEVQAQATTLLALIEQAQGQSEQAQQRLTAWLVRTSTPHTPLSYQLYREVQACLAKLQLAQGNLAAVERWLSNVEQSEEALPLLKRQREDILKIRYQLTQESISGTIEQLKHICAEAQRTDHIALLLEAQVVLVLAYARQGAQSQARAQLQALLERTHSEKHTRLFLDEGEEMAHLLRNLLPHLTNRDLRSYVLSLLNTFASANPTSTQSSAPGAVLLPEPLSAQEKRVLRLLVSGNSNADIARELVVSVNTIRTQLQSIYRKLNVTNRVEASNLARQLELL